MNSEASDPSRRQQRARPRRPCARSLTFQKVLTNRCSSCSKSERTSVVTHHTDSRNRSILRSQTETACLGKTTFESTRKRFRYAYECSKAERHGLCNMFDGCGCLTNDNFDLDVQKQKHAWDRHEPTLNARGHIPIRLFSMSSADSRRYSGRGRATVSREGQRLSEAEAVQRLPPSKQPRARPTLFFPN